MTQTDRHRVIILGMMSTLVFWTQRRWERMSTATCTGSWNRKGILTSGNWIGSTGDAPGSWNKVSQGRQGRRASITWGWEAGGRGASLLPACLHPGPRLADCGATLPALRRACILWHTACCIVITQQICQPGTAHLEKCFSFIPMPSTHTPTPSLCTGNEDPNDNTRSY